ncbi:hypothetical protein BDW59DRAFT_165922 [Aspergillus cavernicola]|uniref:Uncharacterized protein n=1 Tax=Aspergillus cavernicola TaxID=176166 RepID=A0ABR4HQU6_9EURO
MGADYVDTDGQREVSHGNHNTEKPSFGGPGLGGILLNKAGVNFLLAILDHVPLAGRPLERAQNKAKTLQTGCSAVITAKERANTRQETSERALKVETRSACTPRSSRHELLDSLSSELSELIADRVISKSLVALRCSFSAGPQSSDSAVCCGSGQAPFPDFCR